MPGVHAPEQVPEAPSRPATGPAPDPAGPSDHARVLALQRSAGNAAVSRMLARTAGTAAPPAGVRDRLLEPLERNDAMAFMSLLRGLSDPERAQVEGDAEFWKRLRTKLRGLALWVVQLRLRYGSKYPTEVNELSTAIHTGEADRVARLLIGYDSLKRVPGLREALVAKFGAEQGARLQAYLTEGGTRAESGLAHYKEAHYESGVMKQFTGDRNYELWRGSQQLRVIVRINLTEDAKNAKQEITDALIRKWEQGIDAHWNHKFRLRSGAKALDVWFVPVFVYHDTGAHHQVTVTTGDARSDEGNWHSEDVPTVAAHEFGHMLGNPDEYRLPATAAEIDPKHGLSADELKRNNWKDLSGGVTQPASTAGYSKHLLMGSHYLGSGVVERYAWDIRDTFNAKLRQPGEDAWTVEVL